VLIVSSAQLPYASGYMRQLLSFPKFHYFTIS
jgi:hypothetical protein